VGGFRGGQHLRHTSGVQVIHNTSTNRLHIFLDHILVSARLFPRFSIAWHFSICLRYPFRIGSIGFRFSLVGNSDLSSFTLNTPAMVSPASFAIPLASLHRHGFSIYGLPTLIYSHHLHFDTAWRRICSIASQKKLLLLCNYQTLRGSYIEICETNLATFPCVALPRNFLTY
jgi:hypothetical protein